MPQMKPMNWLFFYILFSIYIIFINILNFYTKTFKSENINNKKDQNKNKYINWKW